MNTLVWWWTTSRHGNLYASYTYDAWVKTVSVKNFSSGAITDPENIANLNPIRYRSYFWDAESGLYYLKSRYYDPQVKRFLNADSFVFMPSTLSANVFAYCNNNPVISSDPDGHQMQSADGGIGSGAHISGNRPWSPPMPPRKYFEGPVQNSESETSYGDGDVPYYEEPGSTAVSPNGEKERVYGKDRRPNRDRHKTNHGNAKEHPYVPHDHDWGYSEKGDWNPGPGYPSRPGPLKPREEIVPLFPSETIVEAAAWGAAIYIGYSVIKWGAAGALAGVSGGASLVGAALLP